MSKNFLKFKNKLTGIRILKSLLGGLALASLAAGISLILSKLALVGFEPIISLPIGIGVLAVTGVIIFFALGISDKALAEDLDLRFDLKEKVQTMIAYNGESGEMIDLQRQDADKALEDISPSRYKPRRLWIYLIALSVGIAALASAFLVKNKRDYVPPEEVIPFELSSMQIAGLEELIKYVEESEMDAEYKDEISAELADLLADLKLIDTEPEMQAELAKSMALILDITYDSSSSTEILNALWDTGDIYLRHFAKVLDTSSWSKPDWGDYAEKMTEYVLILCDEDTESADDNTDEAEKKSSLKWTLENTALKLGIALDASDIGSSDRLHSAIARLANAELENEDGTRLYGLSAIAKRMSELTYAESRSAVDEAFEGMTEELYSAISSLKINTNVGEYTMTKLSTLFLVPLPEFERPEFVKNREDVSGGQNGSEEDNDEDGPSDGGVGEGATFGSKDLVLDPSTGNYVEYGTLIDRYYAVMYEKLQNGSYTEEQAEAIKNYFALLYSGIEKEEGN